MIKRMSKLLLNVGQHNIYKYYEKYKSTQGYSREDLEKLQRERIKNILDYAYNNIPFYREKFDKCGVKPSDFVNIKDIEKFPTTSVDELRKAIKEKKIGKHARKTKLLATTGSTGTPFVFPINKEAEDERLGCMFRTIEWYGHELGVKNARFWRTSKNKCLTSKIKENLLGRRLELSIYDADDPEGSFLDENKIKAYIEKIKRYKPEIIDGYVGAFVIIANYILENKVQGVSPKSIVTGGEYLSFESRKLIEKAFRCKVYNRYGGTETSLMAHECEKGNLHIISDKLYLEVLKDDVPVQSGELGEVVVTDFTNMALPFIRFKVGDVALADDPKKVCACGRGLHLLKAVEGRINDLMILKDGRILVSHVWHNLFRDYDGIKTFQVVQKDYDLFHVNIVLNDKHLDLTNLKREVSKFLPNCKIEWYIRDKIAYGKGGKFRHSISEIPIFLNQIRSNLIMPAKDIGNIKPYTVTSTQSALKDRIRSLKLDWNEGTISPPKQVINGLIDFIKSQNSLNWYPDIDSTHLRDEIGKFLNLPQDNIDVFVGSDGALDYIAKTFIDQGDEVLIVGPTYDQFRVSLEARGAKCKYVYGEDPFKKNLNKILHEIHKFIKIIYLVNPNNPTGVLYSVSEIERILQKAKESLVIIDEAYIEFCKDGLSCKDLISKYDNIIILRTFSKAFCLAGIRLGYIIANPSYIELIKRIKNSKEVSPISQLGGILALKNLNYYERYLNEISKAKEFFTNEMKKKGYTIYEGGGNYVMVKVDLPHLFISNLRSHKIYIRDRSYLPQLDNFVRITIGTQEQMEKVLDVIDNNEN